MKFDRHHAPKPCRSIYRRPVNQTVGLACEFPVPEALQMSFELPGQMTVEDRRRELASLFAAALLSLKQHETLVTDNPAKLSPNRLEAVSKTGLNGHQSG